MAETLVIDIFPDDYFCEEEYSEVATGSNLQPPQQKGKVQAPKKKVAGKKKEGTDKPPRQIFSKSEVKSLISLVRKYKHVVECKKTDGQTWEEKRQGWERIALAFNAECPGVAPRTSASLQNKWNILKTESKKAYAAVSKVRKGTGGGRPATPPISDTAKEVSEILTSEAVHGEFGAPDSDSCILPQSGSSSMSMSTLVSSTSANDRRLFNYSRTIQEDDDEQERGYEHLIREDEINDELLESAENQFISPKPYVENRMVSKPLPPDANVGNWSSYTPRMLNGEKHPALCNPNKGKTVRQNNKRSYDMHNENLKTKGNVLKMQEKYYESLNKIQEVDEQVKLQVLEVKKKEADLKEEMVNYEKERIKQLYDLKCEILEAEHEQKMKHAEELHELRKRRILQELN